MAYDLHIVRTKDWTEAATAPITRQDVDALIAADPELAWSTTDYVDMTDESGASARYFMITWRGDPRFWWYRDQIQCSAPDEPQQSKLIQMARALDAHVLGDDGESYPLDEMEQMSASSPPLQTGTPWPLWKQCLAALLAGCVLLALKLLIFGG